jgi:SAM domain (Sterile alpha motif)
MQIADWLNKLDLGHYAGCFAENDIDVSVLRHLTDEDLKDLGVSLGHRRKILAAITELASVPSATPQASSVAEERSEAPSAARLR